MKQKQKRDHSAESGQEQMVERYLRENPGSTVPQIRDGIEATTGIRIERIQARIAAIGKRIEIRKGTGDYGRTAYSLGKARRVLALGGIEIRLVATEGQGIRVVAQQHGSDVESSELQEMIARVLGCAQRAMEARAVPLAEAAARAEGLLLDHEGEEHEDDWLGTLSAYGGVR